MVILAVLTQIIRPNLRLDLFYKQIGVTVIIFSRSGGDNRERNYVSEENHSTHVVRS